MTYKSTRGSTEVSHLAYADDIIIFTQAAPEPIRRLKDCLNKYTSLSGKKINVEKSNFFLTENHEEWAAVVETEGGFSKGSFPFLYLGVPIYKGAKRTDMFLFLRDKISRRITGWAHRHLSFGGRLTLIQSTLEAIPLHVFQAIEPTKGALHFLEQQIARFFWGSTEDRKRTHWISWEQVCLPTAEGGLGIRRFEDVLNAFSLKLWWRFRHQNSLWALHMYSKYCRSKSPMATSITGRSSPTWRRLASTWLEAQPHTRWIIGDGKALFWDDIWLGDKPLREISLDTSGNPTTKISEFWRNDRWDQAKLHLIQQQTGLPQHITDEILKVPILLGYGEVPRWTQSRRGEFTVTSAWELGRARKPIVQILGDIWNEGLSATISIFMWRLISNRIPVDTKLQWRNINLASKCLCCYSRLDIESLHHLFVRGQGACRAWDFFDKWFDGPGEALQEADTIPTRLEKWARRTSQSSTMHIARIIPCLVCWYLWAERNNSRHNGARFREYSVIWQVQIYIQRLVETGRLQPKHFAGVSYDNMGIPSPQPSAPSRRPRIVQWRPPESPWIKLNVKGMFEPESGRARGGGIIRDHQGALIQAFSTPLTVGSELAAEVEIICRGLLEARKNGAAIWVETSSQQAIALIKSGDWGPASCRHPMAKLRILQTEGACRFTHVRMGGNKAATFLAQLDPTTNPERDCDASTAPSLLRAIVRLERVGVPNIEYDPDIDDTS